MKYPQVLACLMSAWLALGMGFGHAQSLTRTLENMVRPGSAQAEEKPANAAEQLPYAKEKAAASLQERDLVSSDAFRLRLEQAAYPETERPDFLRQAQIASDSWGNAVIVLENIMARETLQGAQDETVVPPKNSEQALVLDQELGILRERLVQLEFERDSAKENLENAMQRLRVAKRNAPEPLSETNATASSNPAPDAPAPVLTEKEELARFLAQLTLQAAEAEVFYQRWSEYRQTLEETKTRARIAEIEKAIGQTGFHRILQSTRAREEIERLRSALTELESLEAKTAAAFEEVSQEAVALRKKLAENPASDSREDQKQKEQLQAVLALFDEHDFLRTAARARTQFNHQAEGLWSRVLDLLSSPSLVNLKNARQATEQEQAEIRTASARLERGLSNAQTRAERLSSQLSEKGLAAAEKTLLQRQQKANAQAIEQMVALKKELTQIATAQARLIEELDAEIARTTAAESFHALALGIWRQIQSVWNYPLIEQAGRSLTLGLIATALLALIFAIVIARFLARWVCRSLQGRFKLVPSQADLIEKITLYVSSIVLVLMVLQWLNIPLTVFAFLGGALAVGIGFGSQNLINNFISGLILLLERKISVGDFVEVDGNFGKVTSLGSRCSGILKFDGVEVLVPNSSLLEKNVINWTLSDPRHRYDWSIGVAYGSDIDLVFSTLHEILKEQPELLKDPAPEVAFENFGASTLDFHVFYWMEIGSHNARQVASEMRRKIDRVFRERGIEIAFPRQDIHLKVDEPVPVYMQEAPDKKL